MNRLLSIGVCVYNGEKTIGDTLNSILLQIYRPIEVVIVNDCSKDNTLRIVSDFKNKNDSVDFAVKIVNHEINTGIAEARNTCIANATGKWFGFIDSDDTLVPSYGVELISHLEDEHAEIAVFDFNKVSNGRKERVHLFNKQDIRLEDYLLSFPNPWNKLYSLDLLHTFPQPFNNYYYEDLGSIHRFFLKSKKTIYINQAFIDYNLGNGLSQCYDERTFQILEIVKTRNLDFKMYADRFVDLKQTLLDDSVPRIFDQLIALLQLKNKKELNKFYIDCLKYLNKEFEDDWKQHSYFKINRHVLRLFRNLLKHKFGLVCLTYNPVITSYIKKNYRL